MRRGKGALWGQSRTMGAVEETVAGLNGVVHLIRRDILRDLPQAEANKGHSVAIIEANSGWVDHDVGG